MTYPIPRCDQKGCPGHLGKFSSCLAEWLWECSLDGDADESFGDTDWHGHYAMLIVSDDPSWTGRPGGESSTVEPVTPTPGVYMVITQPTGVVSVLYYATVEACMGVYAELREEYYRWSDEDGTDDDGYHHWGPSDREAGDDD